ncbi:MAG: hypothetical protein J6X37_03750 [Treponema sp.]|uniref:TP0183 family DNA metabolism protein n=1 Tax=Treponema sp. TaxID=166 RepID=UPI001B71CF4E|nr:hypothetical protein [Treponema sp.]MBP5587822.1 hypothetical protein [Treponema sp.]MCR5385778.1 hypothetical protein [Treponema sp.]
MRLTKKITAAIFLILMHGALCFCQENFDVYFYGVIAPFTQDNQVNITQDLFAAQLRSIPEIKFVDVRNGGLRENFNSLTDSQISGLTKESIFDLIPSSSDFKNNPQIVILFSKIDKLEDETYLCTYYLKNLKNNKITVTEKSFDTYYNILSDARVTISKVLSENLDKELSSGQGQQAARKPREPINEVAMTVEGVSGTWSGEKGITKIILMRSGRGFVIFENGASMNITVEVEKTENDRKILKIKQNGNFNASFYPDIPRQKVLAFADKAMPIEWSFFLTGTSTLTGFRNSLTVDDKGNVGENRTHVSWTKIN